MRSRESRDRFVEDILSDADKARRWAAECSWEPVTAVAASNALRNAKANALSGIYARQRPSRSDAVGSVDQIRRT